MVQEIDVFPTIMELVGLENPPGVQGRSQAEILTSAKKDTGYEYVLIDSGRSGARRKDFNWDAIARLSDRTIHYPDVYSIRGLKYRYSYYRGKDYGELYDLEKDPQEFDNLWNNKNYAEIKQKLHAILLERILDARDPLPVRQNFW
jgi:arylsulfatase A-like enzyme